MLLWLLCLCVSECLPCPSSLNRHRHCRHRLLLSSSQPTVHIYTVSAFSLLNTHTHEREKKKERRRRRGWRDGVCFSSVPMTRASHARCNPICRKWKDNIHNFFGSLFLIKKTSCRGRGIRRGRPKQILWLDRVSHRQDVRFSLDLSLCVWRCVQQQE